MHISTHGMEMEEGVVASAHRAMYSNSMGIGWDAMWFITVTVFPLFLLSPPFDAGWRYDVYTCVSKYINPDERIRGHEYGFLIPKTKGLLRQPDLMLRNYKEGMKYCSESI